MAGLDLSGVAKVLASWLVDEVEISVDNGVADDVLNPDTGRLEPAAPKIIYAGRGAVLPHDRTPWVPDINAQVTAQETRGQYRLVLPDGIQLPEVRAGDQVRVTQANGATPDPLITRRRFEVVDLAEVSSFRVGTFIPLKQTSVVAPPAGP